MRVKRSNRLIEKEPVALNSGKVYMSISVGVNFLHQCVMCKLNRVTLDSFRYFYTGFVLELSCSLSAVTSLTGCWQV